MKECGRSSGVEHNLAKVGVEGSNPFARSRKYTRRKGVFAALFALLLSGCAQDDLEESSDVLEPINRVVFQFNLFFDDFILVPFSSLYSAVVPDPVAKGVKNLLNFTASPISMVSYLMTGQGEKAALTLMRSVVNLVFGFCGLVDVATEMGLLVDPKTIGQGLGSLGVGTGPYLMLPFLGPTNPRDFVGDFLEALYNPVGICVAPNAQRAFYLSRQGTYMISTRAGVLDVESDIRAQSADYYETFRCMYWQKAGKTTAEEDTPVPVRKDR